MLCYLVLPISKLGISISFPKYPKNCRTLVETIQGFHCSITAF